MNREVEQGFGGELVEFEGGVGSIVQNQEFEGHVKTMENDRGVTKSQATTQGNGEHGIGYEDGSETVAQGAPQQLSFPQKKSTVDPFCYQYPPEAHSAQIQLVAFEEVRQNHEDDFDHKARYRKTELYLDVSVSDEIVGTPEVEVG